MTDSLQSPQYARAWTRNTVQFVPDEMWIDGFYTASWIKIVAGHGQGQAARQIIHYDGATRLATVRPEWETIPDQTTRFVLQLAQDDESDEGYQTLDKR